MLILLQRSSGLAVNPDHISWMGIRRSNGYAVLNVKMKGGDEWIIRHTPECSDGDDIHAVHKRLLEAQ